MKKFSGRQEGRVNISSKTWFKQAAVLTFSLLAGWLAIRLADPPRAGDGNILLGHFSVPRALRHVEMIAKEPHPRGTHANANVRDYLVTELRALGYEPTVEKRLTSWTPNVRVLPVENIIARKSGVASTRAVAVCAHYDSTAASPGASDNGAAVASILETLRALQGEMPLKNDLIILITDGEENGLLGSRTFALEHPWIKDIGVVFNFDARGTRGASIMFETSPGNLNLIREFAATAPDIRSTSLSTFVYERMPNNTDFTNFKRAGVPGLNFAFIEGPEHFHRPSDTYANLNRDTLQHTGNYMVSLVRHFGNVTLPLPPSGNAIYFNPLGSWFVYYSQDWMPALNGFLALIAIVIIWLLRRSGILRISRLSISFVSLVLSVTLIIIFAWTLRRFTPFGGSLNTVIVLSALATCCAANVVKRWCNTLENTIAAFIAWTALAIAAGFFVPPGSYVFYWPALAGWLGVILWFCLKGNELLHVRYRWVRALFMAAGPLCATMLWSPLCRSIFISLPPSLPVIAAFTILACWPLSMVFNDDLNPASTAA